MRAQSAELVYKVRGSGAALLDSESFLKLPASWVSGLGLRNVRRWELLSMIYELPLFIYRVPTMMMVTCLLLALWRSAHSLFLKAASLEAKP